ncbi:hypothetical protein D4764_17G0006620 [Takifugu flavidus]|uniref:Reverse transcriptase domain-containing protein n=1 Tax=Takifugu flavidus TaxID=433684 RepID=A0A5C6NX24_9TELE|nr:hypothetical protein D4764_17G0006620 [Takifugu flavidus]
MYRHLGKLQYTGTELGSNKNCHPCPSPLTIGNSRVLESPTTLKKTGSRALAVHQVYAAGDQTAKVPAFGRYPKHNAPDPLGPFCRWRLTDAVATRWLVPVHKVVGIPHRWCPPAGSGIAARLKKESYWAFLACETPEAADRYRQAKRSAATAVAKAKTWAWEEFGEAVENDFRTASKRFWTTIRRLRRGKQCTVSAVYSGDVSEVVKKLLGGKAPGVDEIRPEFLKALDVLGLSWLTRLCNIAWAVPLDWQTGVVVPLFKKGDRRVCSNYRGITLLSFPGKVYSGVLERRLRQIVEPRIQEEQCGFRPRCGTVDQLYTLGRVFEGAWEFAQPVHMCFLDLEKAFDRVPREVLWGVLREYGVSGPLIRAVRSLYDRYDVVLLASSAHDLQLSLDRCEAAGMKISTSKSETMVLNWKKVECLLQVKEEILPQVEEFTPASTMEQEIDRRISVASTVMRTLHRSIVVKRELSRKSRALGNDRKNKITGDPREDPGHVGETMSLNLSGNAWGFLWMSWKKWLGRRKSGLLFLGCCTRDLT